MNKYLLISVRPEHVANILNGHKTIELRKVVLNWVKEDLKQGGTVKVLLYCTKGNKGIFKDDDYFIFGKPNSISLNGKVVAEFDLNDYEEVLTKHHIDGEQIERVIKQACIEHDDLDKYVGDKEEIYALHIDNLNIFSEPKELSDFKTKVNNKNGNVEAPFYVRVDKAPQNMMTVWGE